MLLLLFSAICLSFVPDSLAFRAPSILNKHAPLAPMVHNLHRNSPAAARRRCTWSRLQGSNSRQCLPERACEGVQDGRGDEVSSSDIVPREAVLARLKKVREASGAPGKAEATAVKTFLKQLKKKSGKTSVIIEFHRDERLVHHELSALSRACREKGAGAIQVEVEVDDGFADLASFLSEQKACCSASASATGSALAPLGPTPIIQRGGVMNAYDLARAAVMGVSAVVLPTEPAGPESAERVRELVNLCPPLGLASIVEATSASSLASALAAGADVLVFRGIVGVQEALRLRALVPSETMAVVGVHSMLEECTEIDICKQLEAGGFKSVLLMHAAASEDEEEYVRWALETLGSKKSTAVAFPQARECHTFLTKQLLTEHVLTLSHTHTHSHAHAHARTHARARTNALAMAHLRARMHAQTHSFTRARTQTHTHTHTHTQTSK
jgi:indole-3-glycerol phosphate synthase